MHACRTPRRKQEARVLFQPPAHHASTCNPPAGCWPELGLLDPGSGEGCLLTAVGPAGHRTSEKSQWQRTECAPAKASRHRTTAHGRQAQHTSTARAQDLRTCPYLSHCSASTTDAVCGALTKVLLSLGTRPASMSAISARILIMASQKLCLW